jgi:hypothetical protein
MINVNVAYCTPSAVHDIAVRVPSGATIAEVIRQSRIQERCPEINLESNQVGIFNKLCAPGTEVREGDRIEIYRSLIADPKTARRRRAARPDPG